MRRYVPILILISIVACKENLSSLTDHPTPVFSLDSTKLMGCTDGTGPADSGYVRGCALVDEDGRRIAGSHEYGPIPVDSVAANRWFVRWAFFSNVSRIQAMLCKFNTIINDWSCTWNWVTFTANGPVPTSFEPARSNVIVQSHGDWAAYFNLRETGKFRIILQGENDVYLPIADTLSIEIKGSGSLNGLSQASESRSELIFISLRKSAPY